MQDRRETDVGILQACLDKILDAEESLESALSQYPDQAGWLRPELETALRLATMQEALEPRPGFVSASRQRLVAGFFLPTHWKKKAPAALFFRKLWVWIPRRLALQAALALLLGAIILTGVVSSSAARGALPGEAFYPLKTFSESVQLAVSMNPLRRAQLTLDFAGRRIAEMEALMLEGKYDRAAATLDHFNRQVGQVTSLLKRFSRQDVAEAHRLALELIRLLGDESQVSSLLLASAPDHLKAQLGEAIHSSQDRATEVQALFADLGSLQTGTTTQESPQETGTLPAATVESSSTPQAGKVGAAQVTPTPTPRLPSLPRPTGTFTPTERERFTQTPKPSRTPTPTFTPRPTNTPTMKPTSTRRPTNTRRPTRTERPQPRPTRTKKP